SRPRSHDRGREIVARVESASMAGRLRGRTWVLVAGVVLFTALAAWFAQREEHGREDALEPETVDVPKPARTESALANEPVLAAARGSTPRANVETSAATPSALVAGATSRGIVLDVEGRPVAALLLVDPNQDRELRTDANGEFDVSGITGRVRPAPPWVLVRS